MGGQFLDIQAPTLMARNVTNEELIVEFNFEKSEKIITNEDYYSRIRKYAAKIIQKYTHCKIEDCIEHANKNIPLLKNLQNLF